jgi:hypothetical protein
MGRRGNYVQSAPTEAGGGSGSGAAFCNTIAINATPSGPAGYDPAGGDIPSAASMNFNISGAPAAANAMYLAPMTDAENFILMPFPIGGTEESPNAGFAGGPTNGMGPWMFMSPTAPASGIFESDAGLGGTQDDGSTFFLLIFMTQPVVAAPAEAVHAGLCYAIISLPQLLLTP